eukprot:6332071-Alexandrium_andersonii.AAC.1
MSRRRGCQALFCLVSFAPLWRRRECSTTAAGLLAMVSSWIASRFGCCSSKGACPTRMGIARV